MGFCSKSGDRNTCLACAGEGPTSPSCICKEESPESRVLCLKCPPVPDNTATETVEGGTSTGIESGEGIVVDIIILYIPNLT